MSLSRLFFPAGIRIDSTYVGHVGEQSVDNGLEDVTQNPSGDAFPNFTGNKMHAPVWQVDSLDIAAVLGLMTDNDLAADLTAVNADLFFREAKAQGLNEAVGDTAKHQIYRLQSDSLMYWDSLQARQDEDAARISVRIEAIYNGSNDIIQMPAEALPAHASQVAPWTLGTIGINGVALDSVKSLQWQNNVQIEKHASDGEALPTFICIKQVRPVITIETTNLRTVAGWAAEGVAITDFQAYLRRRKPSLLNYADGDSQHIKLAASAGSLKWRRAAGDPGMATIEIHLHTESTLFAVTTGSAIGSVTTTSTTTTT